MRAWSALLLFSVSSLAFAADAYPTKPIRMILPVAPSGGSDITARAMNPKLIEYLGQQVIIDNRPGAGGTNGMVLAARAAPDGYTLIQSSIGPTAVNVTLEKNLPYDTLRDFTPIARGVSALNILVVHPSLPVKSVKDLIEHTKKNPTGLNYGSSGIGHADHLAAELFNSMIGVKMQHIAYKGGAPAMTALLGNNIHLIFSTVSTAISFIKANRIRAIAVTSAKRVSLFPDIPTVAEAGVPGFEIRLWYGLLAPAGTPPDIVTRWIAEVNRIMQSPEIQARLPNEGARFVPNTPEQFAAFVKSEIAKWAPVVKASGARVD